MPFLLGFGSSEQFVGLLERSWIFVLKFTAQKIVAARTEC